MDLPVKALIELRGGVSPAHCLSDAGDDEKALLDLAVESQQAGEPPMADR